MIGSYLNQTAVWRRTVARNKYGEPVFAAPVSIAVRWEGRRRLVRDRRGQEVVSEARVFCLEAVQPGDILGYNSREWIVIAVSEVLDLDGAVRYWEVAV